MRDEAQSARPRYRAVTLRGLSTEAHSDSVVRGLSTERTAIASCAVLMWRDGRVVEGARLESVFRGNSNEGSNPSLSAIPVHTFVESRLRHLVLDLRVHI